MDCDYHVWSESPLMSCGRQNYGFKDVGRVACPQPSQDPQSMSLIWIWLATAAAAYYCVVSGIITTMHADSKACWSSRLQFNVMAADAMPLLLVRFHVGLAVLRGMNGADSGWWLGMWRGCDFSIGAAGGKMACTEAGKHHPGINHLSRKIQRVVTSSGQWFGFYNGVKEPKDL